MKPTLFNRRANIRHINARPIVPVRCAAFTLVEVMVALGLMMVLLAIIFVPLNQAFNFFRIGQARTGLQQAARLTLSDIEDDLRRAIHVYPNAVLPGVTDSEPYNGLAPYIGDNGNCSDTSKRTANTSRIDMLLPETDADGNVVNPVKPGYYIVTYYARRLDATKGYDPIDNPVVMFRAQMPYRRSDNDNPFLAPDDNTKPNVDTTNSRYGSGCTPRGSQWLRQSVDDEPNLELMTREDAPGSPKPAVVASHTLVTPRGMGLPAPRAELTTGRSYQPNSSFICEDSNRDGKIDRVTVNMALEQYEASSVGTADGGRPRSGSAGHRIMVPLVVDLPNVK